MSEWVEYMTFEGVSPMADLRKKNGHEKAWKVDYFGVGNENWGCGGNMTPEYYGNLYRRYQTYVRHYQDSAPIQKICGGPNAGDDNWTKKVLETCFASPAPEDAHGFMDGLSMHYYTVPGESWMNKGSATEFTTDGWYQTLGKALHMDDLIKSTARFWISTIRRKNRSDSGRMGQLARSRAGNQSWIFVSAEHDAGCACSCRDAQYFQQAL